MRIEDFTPKATLLWSTVPKWARQNILQNVFCAQCKTSVEMINYSGDEKNDDLILEGSCQVCGQKVVRVVETSEAEPPSN